MLASNGHHEPGPANSTVSKEVYHGKTTTVESVEMTVATPNSQHSCPPPTPAATIGSVASATAPAHSLPTGVLLAEPAAADPAPTVSVPGGPPNASVRQYPLGDFRNSSRETVRDIQSTIMVNWLRQMQMEKLWSVGSRGEGVILKKDRGSFVCCPETLKDGPSLLYNQVMGMNIRVRSNLHFCSDERC